MRRVWVAVGIAAGGAIVGGLLGLERPSQAPAAAFDQRAKVSRAQHAFCNCMTIGAIDQCLASSETGQGIGVSDQDLLLSACLDRR